MVERDKLLALLGRGADNLVETGVEFEQLEQEGDEVAVGFSDGSSARFDLVVGCDGLHSRVRQRVFGVQPVSTGWSGLGLVDGPRAGDGRHHDRVLGRQVVGSVPLFRPGMRSALSWGCPRRMWHPRKNATFLRTHLAGMGGLVPHAVAALDDNEEIFRTEFYTLRLEAWYQGRVALVGDACSSFFPFGGLGIGASMAMESAAVLADELSRVDGLLCGACPPPFTSGGGGRGWSASTRPPKGWADLMLDTTGPPPSWRDILLQQKGTFDNHRKLFEEPI